MKACWQEKQDHVEKNHVYVYFQMLIKINSVARVRIIFDPPSCIYKSWKFSLKILESEETEWIIESSYKNKQVKKQESLQKQGSQNLQTES